MCCSTCWGNQASEDLNSLSGYDDRCFMLCTRHLNFISVSSFYTECHIRQLARSFGAPEFCYLIWDRRPKLRVHETWRKEEDEKHLSKSQTMSSSSIQIDTNDSIILLFMDEWIIIHCVYITCFFIHSSENEHRLIPYANIVNSAAINVWLQRF